MKGFDFWAIDAQSRLVRVAELIGSGRSDLERWSDAQNAEGAKDHSRSRFVGRFIPAGSSVLDIGCGAMGLRQYLPDGCTYMPADIVKRSDDCQVVDLNKGEFPTGTYDCVVFLGVLEYIYNVGDVLRMARASGKRLFVDYTSQFLPDLQRRRLRGWVNDLSPGDLLNALISADWKNVTAIKVINDRYFYICDHQVVA